MNSLYKFLYKITFHTLIVILFSMSNMANAKENVTAVLDVPGMTCKFCPITIRKALEKVPGVIEVKAKFESKTATVVFDPTITDVEMLTKATANAGYPSSVKNK